MPSALTAGRSKNSTVPLAFEPASMATKASTGVSVATKEENKEVEKTTTTGGLGYIAATEVKVTSVGCQEDAMGTQHEGDVGSVDVSSNHFFQQTYRDEYQPARPNSYEMYCKERQEKKRLEQVKRELSRRQREQEREV